MMESRLLKRISSCLWLLPIMMAGSLVADETDIFFQNQASNVNANVLFMMDVSASMDIELANGETRMQVLQKSFREAMEDAPETINVGLMHYGNATPVQVGDRYPGVARYDWSSIKGIGFPIKPLDERFDGMSVREYLPDFVDTWKPRPGGYTPLVDSMYEAARYFRGEGVIWGKALPEYAWASHPDSYTGSLSCSSFSAQDNGCFVGEEKETTCASVVDNTCGLLFIENVFKGCNRFYPNGRCAEPIYEDEIYDHCQHKFCESYGGNLVYKSPIEYSCQANYLVLMSDGSPEYPHFNEARNNRGFHRYPQSVYPGRVYGRNRLQPVMDTASVGGGLGTLIDISQCKDSPEGFPSATCGIEFADFLANEDQLESLEGMQNILTYAVAYGLGDGDEDVRGTNLLKQMATAQNGFFEADDADGLIRAFKQILIGVEKNSFSFASPSVAVDENNALTHGKYAYMPVFDSNIVSPLWSGNLRKFEINEKGVITNSNGQAALTEKGTFKASASDIWSNNVMHGADVKIGGAASQIPAPDKRQLWTDAVGNSLSEIKVENSDITAEMLSSGEERTGTTSYEFVDGRGEYCSIKYEKCQGGTGSFSGKEWSASQCMGTGDEDDEDEGGAYGYMVQGCCLTNTTQEEFERQTSCGVYETISPEYRAKLINFIRGYKEGVKIEYSSNESTEDLFRQHMGDMLNSQPVSVRYGNKTLVFAATNEGFLHAINADSGKEEWAFMPSVLLKNQDIFFRNEASADNNHIYGIDGSLLLKHSDDNKDGVIDSDEEAYLYFGLRRGGRMYYALDISSAGNPKIKWKIGIDTGSTALSDLGEAWSRPTFSRLRQADGTGASVLRSVLVFGGGYDPRKDVENPLEREADQWGKNVYIVDAETGRKIWSLEGVSGSGRIEHSIPGDIRILDMDNDGGLDRLYFSDTGGNVWRVDMFANSETGSSSESSAKLTHFAALGTDDGEPDGNSLHRMFFYEPDTALRLEKGEPILTVSLGSGYRTQPLNNDVTDDFYVMRDPNPYNVPESDGPDAFKTITKKDLASVEMMRSDESSTFLDDKEGKGWKGWYYPFAEREAEKVLASSITFLDKVLFTTFSTVNENGTVSLPQACDPATNTSRAYVLDLMSGRPVADLNRDNQDNDDFVVAGINEILGTPQLIFSSVTGSGGDGACDASGSCEQHVKIRVGKMQQPLLDDKNTSSLEDAKTLKETVDISDLIMRMYWFNGKLKEDEAGVAGH